MTINNEPWFVGNDVAQVLGYTNPSEALSEHVDADDKLNSKTLSSCDLKLGQRGGWLINESGLHSLILSSKLPGATVDTSVDETEVGNCAHKCA